MSHRDERFRDQVRKSFGDASICGFSLARNRAGCFERELTDEYGQPSQHRPFVCRERFVTPIERGAQGLVPGQGGPSATRQKTKAVVEALCDAPRAERVDPTSRQLDCQRNAVELAANIRNDRRIAIVQLKSVAAGRCAFDEQLDGRKIQRLGSRQACRYRRCFQ